VAAVELATFEREGYIVLRNFFSAEEMDLVRNCVQADPLILGSRGRNISVVDASGRDTRLTLWWFLGDDTFGQLGRGAGLVSVASALMAGAEPYHSHTKVLLKEPRQGGAWEWHQDFGYWYSQGLLQPDGIVSAIVAIDENTRRNGAMKVLSRSHRLGRLEHGVYGGQAGADPARVLVAMRLPGHQIRSLLLAPGDVAFTHSNLLHASVPNLSDDWRRNVIVAFNSKDNGPLTPQDASVQPEYNASAPRASNAPRTSSTPRPAHALAAR
jgi:hypothetical protein